MKHNNNKDKPKLGEPVLDFISGNTDTPAAKQLTKHINNLSSLWLLAKMANCIKKEKRLKKIF